jgi:hypothetical protein
MKMNPALPLTEPQERRLTITLADLEHRLAVLRAALDRPPRDLRLTRYDERIRADETVPLRQRIHAAEGQLTKMAEALGLKASAESVRRTFVVGLELASIALYEAHPTGELRGCGEVASATATYLGKELPRLEALVREVIRQLEHGAQIGINGKSES